MLQTVDKHYISIEPMYRVIWVVAFLETERGKASPAYQCCSAAGKYSADLARESEPMLGCCWAIVRHFGPTLKQHWLTIQWVL